VKSVVTLDDDVMKMMVLDFEWFLIYKTLNDSLL